MGKSVLLVDDHESVRMGLRRAFESSGFTCVEATHGAHAVALTTDFVPDLIITDLSMPVMNGLDASTIFRKKLPHTPIILYTMYADTEVERLAAAAGVAAVVSKSDPVAELLRRAKTLLGAPVV
jgi:two-component system, NarL family, invasion response regulator UvrY